MHKPQTLMARNIYNGITKRAMNEIEKYKVADISNFFSLIRKA